MQVTPAHFLGGTQAQGCRRTYQCLAAMPPPLSRAPAYNQDQDLVHKSTCRFCLESWRSPIWRELCSYAKLSIISNLHRFAMVVYFPVLVNPEAVDVGVQDHLQAPIHAWEANSKSPQRRESSDWKWAKRRPSLCRMSWGGSLRRIWTWLPKPTSRSSWLWPPKVKIWVWPLYESGFGLTASKKKGLK